MRDIAVAVIVFGLLPWVLRQPYIGVLLWSWLGYMNPHRLGWGFAYNFPFAQVVGLTLLISLIFSREPKRFPITPMTVLWLLFVLWMCVTTLFAFDSDATAQLSKVLKIQVVIFLTLMIMGSRERIILMVWVIAFSIGFFGIKGGFFTVLHGGSYRVWGPEGTFIGGNNELALALCMVLPLFYFLYTQAVNKWVRWGLAASMISIAFSVVGSYSRGAFLAGFAMLFMLWLKSRSKFLTGIAFVLVALTVLAFMPQEWHDRMASIGEYAEDKSAVGRINAWWTAYYIAADRITGGGFEALVSRIGRSVYAPPSEAPLVDAHSIYFEILGEHGFIGLFLFLSLGVMGLLTASWIIRHSQVEELEWARNLARAMQASLIAYATGGAFLGLAYFDLYYHLIAILVLTKIQVKQVLAERQRNEAIGAPWARLGRPLPGQRSSGYTAGR